MREYEQENDFKYTPLSVDRLNFNKDTSEKHMDIDDWLYKSTIEDS